MKYNTTAPRCYLVIGAHPDDPDLMFGGGAIQLAAAGHRVIFIAVTDGGAGHQFREPEELIALRHQETQNAAAIAGIEAYLVLNHPDGRLENTIAIREELLRLIRHYAPDVVITHRTCDYHPDHRVTAQLVVDTSFLIGVPLICRDTPVPDRLPVYAYAYDPFQEPRPFRIDACMRIDNVAERKIAMLDCHRSQFYEWLPWIEYQIADFNPDGKSTQEKHDWIDSHWMTTFRATAGLAGLPAGAAAELFERSPYGRQISHDAFQAIFTP